MLNVPKQYLDLISALPDREVSYGSGGIALLGPADLEQGQTGYRTDAGGQSLTGKGEGAWQEDWLVIGRETAYGDPIFLSTQAPYPVMTAAPDEGVWHPSLVAPTLEAFRECLSLFRELARGRENPAALAANPLGHLDAATYIAQIGGLVDGDPDALEFWMVQAEIGIEE